MTDLTNADNARINDLLQRFARDVQRTPSPRRNELSEHAICRLFAGLMVTNSGPEMFNLANGYLAAAAAEKEFSHAPQLHLVPVGNLSSDEAPMQ